MGPLRDLCRIIDGVVLVVSETAKRSKNSNAARAGDIDALIFNLIKNAVISVTDITGFTKGNVREFNFPRIKESVLYFSQPPQTPVTGSDGSGNISLSTSAVLLGSDSTIVQDRDKVIALDERTFVDEPGISKEMSDAMLLNLEKEDDRLNIVAFPLKPRRSRERKVPSSPFSRALGFAGLGFGLAWGTVQESANRLLNGTPIPEGTHRAHSSVLSKRNAERLALTLCRMRGAALKLGQMLSIQDESLLPPQILAALDIVRQGADVMPRSQLSEVLNAELGTMWPSKLQSFDYEPVAAASIGQVHRAVMHNGLEVAIKIQYPGVAISIDSDIENVGRLLDYTNLIPKGLFLNRAMKVAREELSRECDYALEAANQKRFQKLLCDLEGFYVPKVIDELSSRKVLTTEFVSVRCWNSMTFKFY